MHKRVSLVPSLLGRMSPSRRFSCQFVHCHVRLLCMGVRAVVVCVISCQHLDYSVRTNRRLLLYMLLLLSLSVDKAIKISSVFYSTRTQEWHIKYARRRCVFMCSSQRMNYGLCQSARAKINVRYAVYDIVKRTFFVVTILRVSLRSTIIKCDTLTGTPAPRTASTTHGDPAAGRSRCD